MLKLYQPSSTWFQAENFLVAYTGIVSVFIFILMILFGGIFETINSLFFREISFLISPYSATKYLTVPLFQLYCFHLLLFSLFLNLRFHNILSKLGAIYLLAASMAGFVLLVFPMDPRGISGSVAGITHITVTLIMTMLVVMALFLLSRGLKNAQKFHWLSQFSFLLASVLLISGFITGVLAVLSLDYLVGLTERLPIILFLVWIFCAALGVLYSRKRDL
jgi:hypothetical protein